MPERSKDWLNQAERDLEQARASMRDGRHEWACFAAQQAAEKAAKGLHLAKGQEAWGHVVATRYVNGHPAGAPFEHYGPLQSQQAIDYAGEILKFARSQVA